jgi:hypothetical protein
MWAAFIGIHADEIEPGAKLGPPIGICTSKIFEEVVHPIPGEIWVADNVRKMLAMANLTGISFSTVRLPSECSDVTFAELIIHGRAWRKGSTIESTRICNICGRRGFPSPKNLTVDKSRWDGSDFFYLDHNPNIIVVTEHVAKVFNASHFSNIIVSPID